MLTACLFFSKIYVMSRQTDENKGIILVTAAWTPMKMGFNVQDIEPTVTTIYDFHSLGLVTHSSKRPKI